MNTSYIFTLLLSITFILHTQAQTTFTGTIIDQNTKEPLVAADISTSKNAVATTNYNGQFNFQLEEIPTTFLVSYLGYETMELSPEQLQGVISLQTSSTLINQVIVSANRDKRERTEAPVSISALSSQVLEEAKATKLDEVLNKVTGVHMVDLGSEQHMMAIRQPISTKGLFLYLEDGLPIRPAGIFNHNALLEMNMANLRRIEVVRGPASSTYGSEAIGGAINFITLRPAAIPTGRIGIQGNNNGYRRIDWNASSTFGKLGIGVSGYYGARKNGYRDHSDFNKTALTFRTDYLMDNSNTFTFDITYIDYQSDMTGSLDSTFFYSKNYASQQTFTSRKVNTLRTKLTYNHYWDRGHKTTAAVFARKNSIRQNPSYRIKDDFNPRTNPTGDKNLAHSEMNENKVKSWGAILQHKQNFDILSGASLTLGASIDNSPNEYHSSYISVQKSDEGVYTGFTPSDSTLTSYKVNLLNLGSYANFDIKITPQLQFTAALRYDQINFDFINNLDENAFSGAANDVDNFSAITPKLGLTYNLGKGNGLFANFSQGFLPPQISELYRGVKIPSLEPARYNNYELGGWIQIAKTVSMDYSFYQLDGKNEIISVRNEDGSYENKNAGQTRHRGVEYGLNWKITSDLSWRVSGSNASHKFIKYVAKGKDYSDKNMAVAPSWIFNTELSYKPSFVPHLRASVEWQRISPYYMDNNNTTQYDGYNLFNIRLGYEYKGFEIWTNIMNATDELYSTRASVSYGRKRYSVGERRAFNLGVAYRFEHKK